MGERSRIASLVCPNPTPCSGQVSTPASSGPRWLNASRMAITAEASPVPVLSQSPVIPHIFHFLPFYGHRRRSAQPRPPGLADLRYILQPVGRLDLQVFGGEPRFHLWVRVMGSDRSCVPVEYAVRVSVQLHESLRLAAKSDRLKESG